MLPIDVGVHWRARHRLSVLNTFQDGLKGVQRKDDVSKVLEQEIPVQGSNLSSEPELHRTLVEVSRELLW